MAASPDYVLEKPQPPAAWKTFLDLRVLPVLIDTAGNMEGALELISVQGRVRPVRSVGVALAVGYALGWFTMARRSRSRATYL